MNKKALVLCVASLFTGALLAHAADFGVPTVPTNVSATVSPSQQVSVSWTPSADDTGVVGYYVYRNQAMVANTPGIPYFTDAPPAGYFTYTVSAYDAAGNVSAQSVPSQSVTVVSDTTAPTTPANFSAVPSSSSIAFSWDPSTDNMGVAGYYVYRNGLRIFTPDAITATTYTDVNLLPGSAYTYSVAAYDAAGNASVHSLALTVKTVFDVTPPSTPTALIAKAISSGQVNLSWQPSTDNISVAGYSIYRDGNLLSTTQTNSYQDTGVSPDMSYSYDVYAYDGVANSSKAASVSLRTPSQDIVPPSIPGGLTGTPVSSSEVNLTWRASTDNVSLSGYYIYRDGSQIGTASAPSYNDIGLTKSTTYTYAVVAYDASGNISPQSSVAVKTLATDPVNYAPTAAAPTTYAPTTTSGVTAPGPAVVPTGLTISTNLYLGLRTNDVKTLQAILIAQGYLGASYGTGYYGSLTQAAVQKFQCAQSIVCSGSPAATGWGSVGPRTRKALNGN